MKIFYRCFGCKKYKNKKNNNKNVNSSGVKFTSLVTGEKIFPHQQMTQSKNKEEEIKEQQQKDVSSNNNNINNNNNILISEGNEENKNKMEMEIAAKKESLIIDENESKNNNINNNNNYSKLGLNLNKDIGFDELLLKEDSPLLSDFEKNQKYTKKSLIELFNKFWNLDNYKKVWDKDNLLIEIRSEGTEFCNDFNLIKIAYRQLKTEFKENADIEIIVKFLYEPQLRVSWDKILKSLEILDGDKNTNYICSTWAKSPTFFMSDRESLEKRCIYKNPEDNAIYIMSSSIPDELFPPKKEVVRITNYCNYYKLIDEGDYIGFYSLNQTDFKMSIPQFLINVTLPTTTKNWQIELEKFSQKVKYDKTTSNLIDNNQK
jgi:hypothetical protein